jgi:ABC-2 type transport system permease protein
LALYVANAREYTRDRLALMVSLIMPLVFALFFGLVFGGDDSPEIEIGLADGDGGAVAQQLVAMLQSPGLAGMLVLQQGELQPLLEELRRGKIDLVLSLPGRLSAAVARQETVAFPVYYDVSRQSSATLARGFMESFLAQANLALVQAPVLLRPQVQPIQGEPFRAVDFYVPSMLGVAMLWLGVFGTAQPLVEMREKQVLRRFAVTPISRRTVLLAQVCWRVTVGLIQTALFVALGLLAFRMQVAGWLLFVGVVVLGALTFVTMGYFVAAISPSMESAIGIAQILNFALSFLSGSFFQPEVLPSLLRPALYAMPLTYLSDALRQTMSGFPPFLPLGVDVAVLAGWLAIFAALSVRFWRWE